MERKVHEDAFAQRRVFERMEEVEPAEWLDPISGTACAALGDVRVRLLCRSERPSRRRSSVLLIA